jgi:uncharacterized protein YgiM (DUF1202 family)
MNLRAEAGMNGTILDVVPAGSTVTWLSSSNGWDKITWNGKTGWVKSGVLKTQNGPVA